MIEFLIEKMKIFFHASILGKPRLSENYKTIIKIIKNLGHQVMADHVMKMSPQYFRKLKKDNHKKIFLKRRKEIEKSDMMIAETSQSSLGVGHLITLALETHKSVLALYQEKPHGLLLGNTNRLLTNKQYDTKTPQGIKRLKSIIKTFLEKGQKRILKKRFNLMINEEQKNYLEKMAKEQKISKANFLRQLIDKSLEKNDRKTA